MESVGCDGVSVGCDGVSKECGGVCVGDVGSIYV